MRAPERRAQLLEVARRVFGTSGFHAVSMETVAKEAGVTKPILYDHFPSKKDLYLALIDADLAVLHEEVRKALVAPIGNRERIRASFQAYFDFVDHEGEAFRLVFESDLRNDPAVRQRVERVERGCISAITDTIMGDTGVSRARAELLASGLVGAAETAARFWLAGGRQVNKAEAEALLTALSWRGIASFPLQGDQTHAD